MKFGQELEDNIYEPWRLEYVAYNDIKLDMKERQETHGWDDIDENDFETVLRSEAEKVNTFINRKQREIESRLAYCERSLTQQTKDISPSVSRNLFDKTDDALTEILMDLNDLSKFTRYNYLAIQKLIKKHDKYTNYNNQPLFVDIIRTTSLDKQRFDVALVKISTLHDLCSLRGKKRQETMKNDQNAIERVTVKYWVHPDNVTELKAILLFHLPVSIYNSDKQVEASDSAISSVYFDNPTFSLYQGRLQRDEHAEAIRFRWYGPINSNNNIFIERKTNRVPFMNGPSIKDRFCLDENKVNAFIDGTYTAEQYAHDLRSKGKSEEFIQSNYSIASTIQKSIIEKNLEPMMRVFYNRTAFQIPGDQSIRLSLDTDLTFVREDGRYERRAGSWRRPDMDINYPFDNIKRTEVYKFPYAILETKLQTHLGQAPPPWLTRLLESRLVYEVPRFSNFLQGAAFFWNPRLPLLPWWLNQLELDIRNAKVPTGNFSGLSRSKSLKPLIDGKYRMGYLESQLENRATLKRNESGKKIGLNRGPSIRSVKMPRSVEAIDRKPVLTNINTQAKTPFRTPSGSTASPVSQTGRHGNPFDDPIWSQHDISYDLTGGKKSGSRSRMHTVTPDSRRTTEFKDSSSTEFLMGKQTPRSSYAHNDKITSNDKLSKARLNAYFGEDVNRAEQGRRESYDDSDDDSEAIAERKRIKKDKKRLLRLKEGGLLEPKIFFANERTFINWLTFAALILTVSLTLLNFGDNINATVGSIFIFIAVAVSIYAFGFSRWRAWRITNKPHIRYDDIYGPVVLCILLVGALVTNFALRINHPPEIEGFMGLNRTV